jgi:hypothetical protein
MNTFSEQLTSWQFFYSTGADASESLREYALPALACLGLIVVGEEILRGDTASIFGLVIVIAALLTTASWNAWLLLVEERRD